MKTQALRAFFALPIVVSCLLPARAASPERESIPALIEQLVEVESIETFYAGTFRFKEFPPLDQAPLDQYPPSKDTSSAKAAFRALIRLIEKGPEALPYLLQHLDDDRETRTSVIDDFAASMGPSVFLDYRKGDLREEAMLEDAGLPAENPGPDFDRVLEDYTLTVGDMCFALIGMITNRSYYILVDEFDAQLNSPTRSESIATGVLVKWGPNPEAIDLYEQLKLDLESGDPRFAPSAAKRLLYYFPGISNQLVIAHLGKLLASHQPGSDALADYLEAISWTSDPRIMGTLRRFLRTATDASQIAAAARVYGSTPDPRGHAQLAELADRLKLRRDPSYVKASRAVLELNLLTFPAKKEETIRQFLAGAGPYAMTTACLVSEIIEDAPVAPLVPLLANRDKSTGDRYLIKGEDAEKWPEDDDYLPYRVCDRAYETICRLLGDPGALAIGTHEEMDSRIRRLTGRLAGKPSHWPFRESELKARQKARKKASGSK